MTNELATLEDPRRTLVVELGCEIDKAGPAGTPSRIVFGFQYPNDDAVLRALPLPEDVRGRDARHAVEEARRQRQWVVDRIMEKLADTLIRTLDTQYQPEQPSCKRIPNRSDGSRLLP